MVGVVGNVPSEGRGVDEMVSDESRLVHQLLGDTTDVDASAPQPPRRPARSRRHPVQHRYSRSKFRRFLTAWQAPRASADHDQIVAAARVGRACKYGR